MGNIFGSANSQFSRPEFVEGIGSACLGTDRINRSCGAVIPEIRKGTNRQSAVILLHAGSAMLLACVVQFESVPNRFGPGDQLIGPALNSWRTQQDSWRGGLLTVVVGRRWRAVERHLNCK